MISALLFALLQAVPQQDAQSTGARNPAYARDGRLALSIRGDIWIRSAAPALNWVQVTSGPMWDHQPAWTSDGSAIVYTSNATGNGDLYRVAAGPNGAASLPERLTKSLDPEAEASVASDGSIAYSRTIAGSSKVYIKRDTSEKRFTKGNNGSERWPVWSPDGNRLAYSAVSDDRTRLRVKYVVGDSDRVVIEDRDAEHPAWSPEGDRIVFSTRSVRAGVWVTTPDARYVNYVTSQRAEAAWSPDGTTLALSEIPGPDLGYNGDPNRIGDRELRDDFSRTGRLWFIAAPMVPAVATGVTFPIGDRQQRNAQVIGAFWSRMDSLYFRDSPSRHQKWEDMRAGFVSRAQSAKDDAGLEEVMHDAMRERPLLRDPASGKAAVTSAHPVATAAGLEILRKGGNVVDAAIAVSFAIGVVEPDASGLGGYGQMLVRLSSMERPALIEFMTRVPEEATLANGALLRRGALPPDGPVLVNVPGTLAGMELAWKKYGSKKVGWPDLVAPAIRAAEQGFAVSEGLATTLATEREAFAKYPSSRALFFNNGQPLRAGDTLRNPDLARTLKLIADSGASVFYKGDVGARMVADLRGKGNAMRPTDLSRYFAAERDAVVGSYRGYTLYSSAPPVSGGATLVAQLNLLEQQDATSKYTDDAASLHAILEAWKLVPPSRGRIADPGLWPVNIDPIISKDTARNRWRCFDSNKALSPNDVRGDNLPCAKDPKRVSVTDGSSEGGFEDSSPCSDHSAFARGKSCRLTGTTAFAVADANGNVVSVTQTLGTWGGNFYVSPGLGFLYNDKLGSYGNDPDEYGARLPNARHGSTLAPTIVFGGEGRTRRPVLATSAAGNNWITSAVFSTTVGVLDAHLDAQRAIELPRFQLSQQRGDTGPEYQIQIEDGFAPSVLRKLGSIGHSFQRISLPGEVRMGYAAVITIGDKEVMAGADPRRAGAAGAIGCRADNGTGCHPE